MGKYRWIGDGVVDLFTGIGNQMELDRYETAKPRLPLWTALGMLAVGGGAKALEKYGRQEWAGVVADPFLNIGTFVVGQEVGAFIDAKVFNLTDPGPSPSQFDHNQLAALAAAQLAQQQIQAQQFPAQQFPAQQFPAQQFPARGAFGQPLALPGGRAEVPAFAAEGY